jgi:acyl carrier protein
MYDIETLRTLLGDTLNLGARAKAMTASTPLLGSLPELDSIAVLNVITALQDQLGIAVDDDEINGDTFATLGSLDAFVRSKLG